MWAHPFLRKLAVSCPKKENQIKSGTKREKTHLASVASSGTHFRIVEVLGHHERRLDANLAHLIGTQFHPGVIINHLNHLDQPTKMLNLITFDFEMKNHLEFAHGIDKPNRTENVIYKIPFFRILNFFLKLS